MTQLAGVDVRVEALMSDVFISYSRRDSDFMFLIRDGLVGLGKDVWVDTADIRATAEWVIEIYRGIEGAAAFLFIISPSSVESDACLREVTHAVTHGKRIVPVLWRESDTSKLPDAVRQHQWIAFESGDSDEVKVARVAAALDIDLGWSQFHTWLLTRALRWAQLGKNRHDLLRGDDFKDAKSQITLVTEPTAGPYVTQLQRDYIAAAQRDVVRRRRWLATLSSGGLAVIGIIAAIALSAAATSAARQRQSRSRALAAAAAANIVNDPARALSFAVSAARQATTPEAALAVRAALAADYLIASIEPLTGSIGPLVGGSDPRIRIAQWSSDGGRILTGSVDGRLDVWKLNGGRTASLTGNIAKLSAATFSPDGRYVAATGLQADNALWDTATGRRLVSRGTDGEGLGVRFSSDSRRYLIQGESFVDVYAVPTGRLIGRVAFSPTGSESLLNAAFRPGFPSQIVTADAAHGEPDPNKGTDIWTIGSSRPKVIVSRHATGWVAFSPNGSAVVTTDGRQLALYNADTGRLVTRLLGSSPNPSTIAFSANGQRIGVNEHGISSIYGTKSGRIIARIHAGDQPGLGPSGPPPPSGALDTAGDRVLASGRVWDVTTRAAVADFRAYGEDGPASFSPHGPLVLTVGLDGAAHVWGAGPLPVLADLTGVSQPSAVSFSPNGLELAVAGLNGRVTIWRTQGWSRSLTFDSGVRAPWLKFSSSGSEIVVGGADYVAGYQTASGKLVGRTTYVGNDGTGVTADGREVVAQTRTGQLQIVAIRSGHLVMNLPGNNQDPFTSVTFSPDSKLVAVSSQYAIRILNTVTGHQVSELNITGRGIWFDPTDTYLVTFGGAHGLNDPAILVDLRSGRRHNLPGAGAAGEVAFSGNGQRLITARVGGATVWDTRTGTALLSRANGSDLGMNRDGSIFVGDNGGRVGVFAATEFRQYASIPGSLWALGTDDRYLATVNTAGEVTVRACLICGSDGEVFQLAARRIASTFRASHSN